jgi:hypothetical protein
MKISIASAIALVSVGVMSCTTPQDSVTPAPTTFSGAKGSNPTPTPTTPPAPLPILTPNPTPIYDMNPVMTTGTWTVKSYYRGFSDNTTDYSGYKFTFSQYGVTATDGKGGSWSGSWRNTIGGQILYYGGGSVSVTSMALIFDKSAPKVLFRLNANWNVNSATTSSDAVIDNFEPTAGERVEFVNQ